MAEEIIPGTPVRCGERTIYPLIRISDWSAGFGGYISAEPAALLIEERGVWYYVLLEGESEKEFRRLLDEMAGTEERGEEGPG
jgi:hypothetical protein